ncbi:MAG: hypothetical protein IKR52_06275 [Paludibacteraceae bacterium]|nr:hypothetical protein [Paludibacteraceae bacterium]
MAALCLLLKKKENAPSVSGIGASPDDFTPEWTGYKEKDALKKIMKEWRGVCRNAYEVDGVSVDIIWGKVTDSVLHDGYGLSHIKDKHEQELKGKGFELVEFVHMCLTNGRFNFKLSDENNYTYNVGNALVVLTIDKTNNTNWVLTSYYKENGI